MVRVVTPRVSFIVVAGLMAVTSSARADCPRTRVEGASTLSPRWRAAVDALVRSTAEPGHPWSCAGGDIEISAAPNGVALRVSREGERPVVREVAEPDDLVPLGQALLAAPLPPTPHPPAAESAPTDHDEHDIPSPLAFAPPVAHRDASAATSPRPPARLLLGGGYDARAVGGAGVVYSGLGARAAVPMGRWLPELALRAQTAVSSGPSLDEASVAIAVPYRLPMRVFELRFGPVVRGAAIIRDLPRPAGEQGQLQLRGGAIVAAAFPVVRNASLLAWIDGDGAFLSRDTNGGRSSTTTQPTSFPTFTLGGGLGVELGL